MTQAKRSVVSLACAALAIMALIAAPAAAVKLMVNGTAKSVYFQRMANGFARHMPVPQDRIDLYIGSASGPACPGEIAGSPDLEVAACAIPPQLNPDGRPALRVMPVALKPENIEDLPQVFAHEFGHIELDFLTAHGGILTDADRAEFDRIWRRPAGLGWWDPINASCELDLGPDPRRGETCGEQSAAGEWAADAFALCATGHWRLDYDHIDTGNLPDFGYRDDAVSDMRKRRAPILASCGLFRVAAAYYSG